MKKTGEELKKARIEQNLSLNEVSMATKINARVLEAMEENNSKKLPAKPFLRGFVKTYAEFLKLNPDNVLQLFEEDLNPQPKPAAPKEEETKKNASETPVKKPKPPKKKKIGTPKPTNLKLPFLKEATITKQIFLVVFVVFLIFMIIFVKGLVEKYQSEKQKALTTPVQEQLEPITPNEVKNDIELKEPKPVDDNKPVEEKPKAPEQKTEPAKPEPVKNTESQPEVKKQKEQQTQQKPSTEPKPEPKKQEATPAPEPKPVEKQEEPEKQKEPEATQAASKHEVILEAMDAVTIKAVIDGKKETSFKLEPGKVHVLKGDKIEVNFSDAGSVNVISNGRYLGVPGNLGQSKTVTYP
ncbi:MAG: helix-turn-helix domain-containing protein [Bdellovibrionales bacterium]|nr:helix-turn-helix domain-containing protein [Bdellovibrionales bacterium]